MSRSNIEYKTQRVDFGLGRVKRAKLFEEFARYNARLRELLETNDSSAAVKQSRTHKNLAVKKILWKFWRHAASLHDLLGQAWSCQCKSLHRACLLLHHETNIERIEFSIRFLYAPSLLNNPCQWKWKEMEAQHIDHNVAGGNMTLVVPQVSQVRRTGTKIVSQIFDAEHYSFNPAFSSQSQLDEPTVSCSRLDTSDHRAHSDYRPVLHYI